MIRACLPAKQGSGRSVVWLARLNGVQEVGSSNLPAPTIYFWGYTKVWGFLFFIHGFIPSSALCDDP